jgi:arylsulfatase A-like enzyme
MAPACRASLALLLALAACARAQERERIVLITLDTLRHDALERADGTSDMPLLRARAARGTLFECAWAASSTTQPTHATLLTGRQPWEHGVTRNGIVLGEGEETLAETLKAHGYETHAVVAAYPLHRRFGFAQGFDTFNDGFHEEYVRQWEGSTIEGERFYSLGEAVTDAALGTLAAARGGRQFFWFHYFDAHDPYGDARAREASQAAESPLAIERLLALAAARDPSFADTLERARALYAIDVRALDRALDRLLGALEAERGVRTHVLVTADHGESLGELGCLGHGKRLVPEQLHVPLWIASARLAPGRRDDPAGTVDVARTVLALAGVVPPSGTHGVDLLSERAEVVVGMRRTFVEARSEQLADGTRLALDPLTFYAYRDGLLYAGDTQRVLLDDDPSRPAQGEIARDLAVLFGRWAERLAGVEVEERMDTETQAALQALGYVD